VETLVLNNFQMVPNDLLLLPDGPILVQNLTQQMANVLRRLDPKNDAIAPRAAKQKTIYELSDRA
jgi:hypothetical protein